MNLKDSKTYFNLAKSYAGEAMARIRYEFIEYGARNENYKCLADIIDKIAYQEFNHARMLYTFIQSADQGIIDNIEISSGYPFREKWNLLDNLRLAAEDEQKEAEVYEEYAKVAEKEGFVDVAGLFRNIAKAELCHKKIFDELHCQMKKGSLYKKNYVAVWKCSGCGHMEQGKEAFSECPLCHAKQGSVELILEECD